MIKPSIVLFTATVLLASGCATDDSTAAKPVAATAAPSQAADPSKAALPVLKAGITADEVVRLVGKPLQVEPRPSPQGKAEVWTYRRQVDETTRQVASGVSTVEAYNPITTAGPGQAPEMQFTTVFIRTFQVTQILMFNDKLVTAKQWQEQTTSYN